MAVTHDHGNPKWTREEVVLALDLYFSCKGTIPRSDDPRVRELSNLLRSLPYHTSLLEKHPFAIQLELLSNYRIFGKLRLRKD